MSLLGAIEIQMLADLARLKKDMDEAKRTVGGAAEAMQNSVNFLKGAFAGVAGVLALGGLTAWIQSAIDAADETNKLAQRTGLAADEVAGLQLAFQLGGAGGDAFGTSMAKLSKQVAEGNSAFKALGVETRNADGTLRTSKDVLYDVADAFAGVEDGTAKSALAMEIFGKSGAELIPLLNAGSDGLREMDEMARKLGLSMSEDAAAQAEKFNDTMELIKLSGQGISRQIASELLPTLTNLAGGLLDTITQGDTLRKIAEGLAAALKLVYTVTLGGIEIFSTFGKTIGALGGQLVALATGDFKAVRDIGREWVADIKQDWTKTISNLGDVWSGTAGKTVEAGTAMVAAKRQLTLKTKEQEEAEKAAAAAAAKHAQELDKLAESMRLEAAGLSGSYLKDLGNLNELRKTGRITTDEYNTALQALIDKQPIFKKQAEEEKKALEERAAVALVNIKRYEESEAQIDKNLRTAEEMVKAIERETQQLQMSNAEREISNELLQLERAGLEKGTYAYEQYAERIREAILDRERVKESIDKAKEIEAEWKKVTDSINNSLTDALMRAFESGKGFMQAFRDTLVNAFKTLVLQPTIKAILAPVGGAIGGLFGMGNAAASTGAAGAAGGGLGSLLSMGANFFTGRSIMAGASGGVIRLGDFLSTSSNNTLAGIGDFVSGNAGMIGSGLGMLGNAFAGYGISRALSGGYSAGGAVNTIAGLASMIPGVGPIAGVVGALVNRAFGMRAKEMKDAGITGTITGGDVTGNQFQDWFQKGGWFRSNRSGTDLTAMNSDLAAALDLGASGVLSQVQAYAAALQLPGEALKSVSTNFRVQLTGQADADQKAIATILTDYETALSDRFESALRPLMKAGETASQALQRLAGLQAFSESLNAFGGVFSRIAGSSIAAREHLIDLAGGIDQLMAKAGAFVRDFYSGAEQAGLQARSVSEALTAIGLDGSALGSRADFRRLVESLDVSTEQGRTQLNALLDLAPQFAQLADYLQEQQLTLEQAVAAAPQIAALEALRGEAQDQAAGIDNVNLAIEEGNSILAQIREGIAALQASISSGLAAVASASSRTADAVATGNAIAASTDRTLANLSSDASLAGAGTTYTYDIGGNAFANGGV